MRKRKQNTLLIVGSLVFAVGLWTVPHWVIPLAWSQQGSQANPMRSMMRQMMRGLVPPPGITVETLPDPASTGARLVGQFCGQCHDLPSPRYKTAVQWPEILDRMALRMDMMSSGMMGGGMMAMHRIEAPDGTERHTILEYLRRFAMIEASEEDLQRGTVEDSAVFERTCSQCHVLPSPLLHDPASWIGIVARMAVNMNTMGRPSMSAGDQEAILRFLNEASQH